MKRLCLLLLVVLLPMVASAYDAYINGIYYNFDKTTKTAEVTWRDLNDSNQNAYSGTLEIPSTVNYNGEEYSVTSIARETFKRCPNLLSISIPNSITNIGGNAFDETGWYNNQPDGILYLDNWIIDCKGEKPIGSISITEGTRGIAEYAFYCSSYLTKITIPNSVMYIGTRAFEGCGSLTTASIPNGVTCIKAGTFYGCSSLTSVTILNSVTVIEDSERGYGAFGRCSGLTSVTFGNSLTKIGSEAFEECTSLVSVSIPNSVNSLGGHVFEGCLSLTSVTLSNSITSIPWDAFSGCESLTSIIIPNSVTSIEGAAFRGCKSLKTIEIPNSVTSIGDETFELCSELASIDIPNSVTQIGQGTFGHCYSLKSANIPISVKTLGNFIFQGCINLNSLSISEGITIIPEGICEGCSLLKEVTLPNNVIIIKSKAFSGCYSLESINIPETVEYIYQEAFKDCCFNEGINIYSNPPPFIYDNTFSDFSVPLKVPKGCKKEYQIAQVWKNFTNISELDNSKYLLTYMADGEEYKSYEIEAGETITPELAPTKENYTFSGWSEIPATMPAHDVTITGYFTLNPNATQSITMATSSGSPRTMKGYSSPYGLDFTDVEGVKAYTAVGFSEDHVVYLSRVKVVPPNTGIVLKTENPGITVDVPTTGIDVYLANLLLSAVSNVTVNPTEVIDGVEYRNLMVGQLNGTTTMGFVEFTSSVTRSNNCYLHVPLSFYNSTASARPMDGFEVVFDEGESTDIREIEEKTYHDDNVYDLQGRKVITPTKGLVIKNGKLVFVKP